MKSSSVGRGNPKNMKIKEKIVKSVITKSNLPEVDYVINPYTGCQHACIYCYADFMKRFTGHKGEAWGSFLDAKVNAPETITQKTVKDSGILIGSVTDPYQPLETRFRVTRACLERLLEFQPDLEILTKSSLVLHDLDLLKKFTNLRVGISIGVFDEKLSRKLEPFASPPRKRLEAMRKLHEEGIRTFLFVSPIFPEMTDFEELVTLFKEHVDEVFFENLNIRANNRKRIFEFLKENRPDLIPLYEEIQKDISYWDDLKRRITEYCQKSRLSFKLFFHHGLKK